ncbi:MAG: NfeD family protein, partial [Bacteroidales bacterium]|nr:NfeD family protein [Bacteroidales bacterium]
GVYLLSLMAATVGSLFLVRYLPNIPGANRLFLAPPSELVGNERIESLSPGAALAISLLGAVGTAVTVLRPAGTALFGNRYVDVVSDGSYIPPGTRVQVIEVEGTRIMVKEV